MCLDGSPIAADPVALLPTCYLSTCLKLRNFETEESPTKFHCVVPSVIAQGGQQRSFCLAKKRQEGWQKTGHLPQICMLRVCNGWFPKPWFEFGLESKFLHPPFNLNFTSLLPHVHLFFASFLPLFNPCSADNLKPLLGNHGLQTLLDTVNLVCKYAARGFCHYSVELGPQQLGLPVSDIPQTQTRHRHCWWALVVVPRQH